MRLESTISPIYLADPKQATVLQLGLQSLDPGTWMQPDNDFSQFYQHKLALKKENEDKVYLALPESKPAQQEFHKVLIDHLLKDYRTQYQCKNEELIFHKEIRQNKNFQSLWQSSLLVQEDICLLEKYHDEYRLSAASLCSPSNWALEEKIGKNLDFIHAPVPGYQDQLASRVNRLFDHLKVESPLLRYNWSIQTNNELFWRDDLIGSENLESLPSKQDWYWRVERQTLRRLPQTGAIVFAIRIYLHNFKVLKDYPGVIKEIVKRLPLDQIEYKGLKKYLDSF